MNFSLVLATFAVVSTAAFAPQSNIRPSTALADDLFSEKEPTKGKQMSKALPFASAPKILDGTLAGDAGFE
jgi:hypothetical protein